MLIQVRYWDVERLVQPELGAEAGEVLLVGVGAQHDLGGIAQGQVPAPGTRSATLRAARVQMQEPRARKGPTERSALRYRRLIVSTRRSKLGWSLKPARASEWRRSGSVVHEHRHRGVLDRMR